nr:hypothetical protein [uncultured Flavobacterium sp.]
MYSLSEEEKKQFNKSSKMVMSNDQILYNQQAEELTDRELQLKQAYYLSQINKNTQSIKNNLQFWFYLTILSIAGGVLIFLINS